MAWFNDFAASLKVFWVLSSFIALFEAQSFSRLSEGHGLTWAMPLMVLLCGTKVRAGGGINCKSDHSEMSPQVALMTTAESGVKCRDAALRFHSAAAAAGSAWAAGAAGAAGAAEAVVPAPLYSPGCCCCLSHSSPHSSCSLPHICRLLAVLSNS